MALKLRERFSERYLYLHIAYWIFYIFYFTVQRFAFYNYSNFIPSLKLNLAYLPGVLAFTYFITEGLIPRYFNKRRIVPFLLSLLAIILLVYPSFAYLERRFFIEPIIFNDQIPYSLYNFLTAILIFGFGVVPIASFKIAWLLRKEAQHHEEVEKERLEALLRLKEEELKQLRGQIHPHFLFNILNNAYSLALEKSDKTADVIIKLSDMLSFITYDSNSDRVPLSKDVQFINNYLDLQSLRYDSCTINMKVNGDTENHTIAPMILQTFVENSFKHGANGISGDSWINIDLQVVQNKLTFSVINSKRKSTLNEGHGIGLKNVRRRLELLYPGRYELHIKDSDDAYEVLLRLEL